MKALAVSYKSLDASTLWFYEWKSYIALAKNSNRLLPHSEIFGAFADQPRDKSCRLEGSAPAARNAVNEDPRWAESSARACHSQDTENSI
jgi:hypothetical protein